jgi:thioesterase domain-containing protein
LIYKEKEMQPDNLQEQIISINRNSECLIKVKDRGNKPPIFCMPPISGDIEWVEDIATDIEKDQPLYGFLSVGLDGKVPMLTTIEEMASHYVKIILQEYPEGPYVLSGYSFGGFVAFEAAQQLAALGKKIKLLILFDSYPRKEGKFTYFHMYIPYVLRSWLNYLFNPKNSLRNKWEKIKINIKVLGKHFNERIVKVKIAGVSDQQPIKKSLSDQLKFTNFNAHLHYEFKPYNASKVIFLRAIDNPARHLRNFHFGWKKYVKSDLLVRDLEGHHFYFTKDEENKKIISSLLKKNL